MTSGRGSAAGQMWQKKRPRRPPPRWRPSPRPAWPKRRRWQGTPGAAYAVAAMLPRAKQGRRLETLISRLDQVVAQTRLRLSGEVPEGASRLVSLHDPDARPIKKGRIGKPVEFGYLAQVVDNEDGVVVDHSAHVGNPSDGPLLAPAIRRAKAIAGRAPRAVTADRGYGEAKVDEDLRSVGVKFVAIIRKGRQSAARGTVEASPRFRGLVKWRTGSEGRISALKRSWGWSRSLMDGLAGTQVWCGYGIFANNSQKISRLIAEKKHPSAAAAASPAQRPKPTGMGPPPRSQPPPALPMSG